METLELRKLELIDEALGTQLRLLKSYINKSDRDLARIEAFKALKREVEARLLEQ